MRTDVKRAEAERARPADAGESAPGERRARAPSLLRDVWYYALPGHRLERGRMLAKTICGEPLLFGRDAEGGVFALRDICPHRGIPLSDGAFDGREVECCYHGWRFDTGGRCTRVPSRVEGDKLDVERIRVRSFPCVERQHGVWVWIPDERRRDVPPDQEPIELPDVGETPYKLVETVPFPCHVDHAVVGLMDPAHGPFVHASWWWRPGRSIHQKAKAFEPASFGFRMTRHRPSSNSRMYKILGGAPETEITFRLPGVRVEHVRAGPRFVCSLTAVTPLTETETEVHHVIWWNVGWMTLARPVLRLFAQRFLDQDRSIVVRQQRGLAHDPALMLIDDADTQAKWYFQLKREHAAAREEGRPFVNPVEARVLRWKS